MNYGEILSRGFQITWRYKVLWLFGFLAGLYTQFPNVNIEFLPPEARRELEKFVFNPIFLPTLLGVLSLFVLLSVVVAILKALGRSALVDQVNQIEEGVPPSARDGWGASKRFGGRVFWIAFLLGLPGVGLFLVGLVPLLFILATVLLRLTSVGSVNVGGPLILVWLSAWFIPYCCIAILIGIFFGLIRNLSERVCVLENHSAWDSICGGWKLLRKQSGSVLVMWFILAMINMGLIVFFLIPMFVLLLMLIVPFVAMVQIIQTSLPLVVIIGYIVIVVIIWGYWSAINSVTEPFFSGCWTLAYRQWTGGV